MYLPVVYSNILLFNYRTVTVFKPVYTHRAAKYLGWDNIIMDVCPDIVAEYQFGVVPFPEGKRA